MGSLSLCWRNNMGKWLSQFQIKDLLDTSEDEDSVKAAANQIMERLRVNSPFNVLDTTDLSNDFYKSSVNGSVDDFNDSLDYLYDLADAYKVWIS